MSTEVIHNLNKSPLLDRRQFSSAVLGSLVFEGSFYARNSVAKAEFTTEEPKSDFSLPTLSDKKDTRLKGMNIPDILIDPSMYLEPSGFPIEEIKFNPKFETKEGENRLGLVMMETLAHGLALGEYLADSDNPQQSLFNLITSGKSYPTPSYESIRSKIDNKEKILIPTNSFAMDDVVGIAEPNERMVNLKKGIRFNFTSEPKQALSLFAIEEGGGYRYTDGYTFRVDDEGQLQIDIYYDFSVVGEMLPTLENSYDFTLNNSILIATSIFALTLGWTDDEGVGMLNRNDTGAYRKKISKGEVMPNTTTILINPKFFDPSTGFSDMLVKGKISE